MNAWTKTDDVRLELGLAAGALRAAMEAVQSARRVSAQCDAAPLNGADDESLRRMLDAAARNVRLLGEIADRLPQPAAPPRARATVHVLPIGRVHRPIPHHWPVFPGPGDNAA